MFALASAGELNKMAQKKIYLNDADETIWNSIPEGERSAFVSDALKIRAKPVACIDSGRMFNLRMPDRFELFRLTSAEHGVYWVKARHPELMAIPTSKTLTVCPRCACNYYDGTPEIESNYSSVRAYCPECRKETQERKEQNEISGGEIPRD